MRHQRAAGGIEMELVFAGRRLRVQVSDAGSGFPKPRIGTPSAKALGGRGLLIVDRVASRWGVTPGRPTRVWFELDG